MSRGPDSITSCRDDAADRKLCIRPPGLRDHSWSGFPTRAQAVDHCYHQARRGNGTSRDEISESMLHGLRPSPHHKSRHSAGQGTAEKVAYVVSSDIDAGNCQQHRRREEYEPTLRQALQQKRSRNSYYF
jgi:hypothetical protein